MAGSCRRLFAFFPLRNFRLRVFWLICFWLISTAALFPQKRTWSLPAEDRAVAPIRAPKLRPRQGPSRTEPATAAPVWIPPPVLPRRYPIVPANPGLPQDVFQQLVRTAGIIFSGRVVSVGDTASSSGPEHAATSITFQVEHAIRATLPNQSVTIHEWAGLWSRGERYRVGERVLLFLYGPSKLGLTSPVAGTMGRFAVDSQDRIVIGAAHIAAFTGNPLLRGRSIVPYVDFALAVRKAEPEEWIKP
jgi:hypothetical protein